MRTFGIIIATIIATVLVGAPCGLAYIYSGAYDIGATAHHAPPTRWATATLRRPSVAAHAEGIQVPLLAGEQRIRTGFAHYRQNCAQCHGAPGVDAFEGAEDMYPSPPDLAKVASQMPPAKLFWALKHGIKMSGMPAWGPTHSDDAIWAMVAFVQRLPDMTADEYAHLDATVSEEEHHHGDEHEANHHGQHAHG